MIAARNIIDRIEALPALPATINRVLAIAHDPESRAADVVDIIKHDQVVTGQVLRICNSAASGLARKVGSIHEAVKLVGTARVVEIAMAAHTSNLLEQKQSGYGLEEGELWRHSVAVAIASTATAKRLSIPDEHLVFTAGLLHDIGKTILNQYVADELREIMRLVVDERQSFPEAEHQVLGYTHEQIGAMLAEKWGLPEEIVRCIRYHHDPGAMDAPDPLVDVVYLANAVCLLLGIGLGSGGLWHRADQAVMERHNLRERDLEVIGVEMMAGLSGVEDAFADSQQGGGETVVDIRRNEVAHTEVKPK